MALFGSLSTLRAQAPRDPGLQIGLDYLDQLFRAGSEAQVRLNAVPVGETVRVELGRGVFALEQAYETKAAADGRWESHKAFIDIQAILSGEEFMGVCDVAHLAVEENLTPAKDLLFYRRFEGGSRLHVRPAEAAIFFPVDGHMPCLRVGGPVVVRKSVVKVPVF